MNWKLIVPVFAAVLAVGAGRLDDGWWEADKNYPGVQEAVDFAVAENPNIATKNEVISVKIQVGIIWNYSFV